MQAELDAMGLDVQILSINKTAAEGGVSSFSSDHALPMVQDTSELGLWDEWDATWRDVYIVDEDNVHIGTVNLTGFSLASDANYEEVKNMFIEATSD